MTSRLESSGVVAAAMRVSALVAAIARVTMMARVVFTIDSCWRTADEALA